MNKAGNLWVILLLMATMFLLAACGSSQATDANEATAVTESEEHADDEHDTDHDAATDGEHADGAEHAGEETVNVSMEHEHAEVPGEFAALENPLAHDESAIAAGQEIFVTNCVACHGETGRGDGAAAASLDPKPADLTDGAMMSMLSDSYLYWRVSKGGVVEPFNSAMPAWENALTEDQRWQVISYVRSLTNGEQMDMDMDGEHTDEGG